MNENIYKQIPEDIKKAINSSEVYTALEKIGDDFDLNIDQIGQLNYLTEQVMIGILKSDKYVDTVSEELEINRSKARDVAESVNKMIFLPIRESMRRMQDISEGNITPPPPRPVIKAPSVTNVPQNNTQNENVYTKPIEQNIEIVPTEPIKTENVQDISRKEIGEIEKMGNFTIDKHESEGPQFEDQMEKEDMMKVIEEPENVVEHLLPSGVSGGSNKKEPIVIKTVPGQKSDPYREPLI
jgi:hypothetical protein